MAALQEAPALGITRVSLNFAMFRSALARGERIGAGPVLRGWRGLLVFLSRWFQIESLYKFNEKFQPDWVPRFLVFPNSRDLPRIGFAIMQAEGFVTLSLPLPDAIQRFLPGRRNRQPHRHRSRVRDRPGRTQGECGRVTGSAYAGRMVTLQGRIRPAGLPEWDRCAVMGVVNVTPDSFSDGGRWFDPELAVKHGLDLVAQGADLVDVGGESTRPGATRVDEAEELRRVVPGGA